MNSILISLFQEPAAICEFLVALLTACYLFKLTFLAIAEQRSLTKGEQSAYDTGSCINTWNTPLSSEAATYSENLRNNFLKLFAVGALIPTSKRSLRRQFFQKIFHIN